MPGYALNNTDTERKTQRNRSAGNKKGRKPNQSIKTTKSQNKNLMHPRFRFHSFPFQEEDIHGMP
jgi:hypothetical protein